MQNITHFIYIVKFAYFKEGLLLGTHFYIQSFHMTEYFSPERALSVRVYVCMCVCVCVCVYVCMCVCVCVCVTHAHGFVAKI